MLKTFNAKVTFFFHKDYMQKIINFLNFRKITYYIIIIYDRPRIKLKTLISASRD